MRGHDVRALPELHLRLSGEIELRRSDLVGGGEIQLLRGRAGRKADNLAIGKG